MIGGDGSEQVTLLVLSLDHRGQSFSTMIRTQQLTQLAVSNNAPNLYANQVTRMVDHLKLRQSKQSHNLVI